MAHNTNIPKQELSPEFLEAWKFYREKAFTNRRKTKIKVYNAWLVIEPLLTLAEKGDLDNIRLDMFLYGRSPFSFDLVCDKIAIRLEIPKTSRTQRSSPTSQS